MEFVQMFFIVLFILVFFGVSVYAVVFFVLTPPAALSKLHWSMKFIWYYGIGFVIFTIAAMFFSFVVWIAFQLMGV